MDKLNMAIAQAIAKHRHDADISQEDLADLAGIHRTYVSQIERGLKMPTMAIIFRISKALNIKPSQLISEIERQEYEL